MGMLEDALPFIMFLGVFLYILYKLGILKWIMDKI